MLQLFAVTAGIALVVFALTLGFLLLMACVMRALDRGPDPDDDGAPGDGGGGRRPPRPPSAPGGEPAWWPDFERDLADYVRQRATPSLQHG